MYLLALSVTKQGKDELMFICLHATLILRSDDAMPAVPVEEPGLQVLFIHGCLVTSY